LPTGFAEEYVRADIEAMTGPEERKSNAGRKPYDAILKFKIVVLQSPLQSSRNLPEIFPKSAPR